MNDIPPQSAVRKRKSAHYDKFNAPDRPVRVHALIGFFDMNKKTLLALLLFLAVSVLPLCAAHAQSAAPSDEQIVHEYLSIFAPAALGQSAPVRASSRDAGQGGFPDATTALLRVVRRWNHMDPQTRAALEPYFEPVPVAGRDGEREAAQSSGSCSTLIGSTATTRQSRHFTIHYTTDASSQHAVAAAGTAGTPTYISNILAYAENVYSKEIGALGFQAPPMASDGRYHIYICNIVSRGYLGLTVTNAYYANNSAGSYLELDNDYSESNALRDGQTVQDMLEVTMAHEFFHAIQFGLNWRYPSYWALESTAVWMEDYVYPDNNDYIAQYLSNWFANTTTSIDHYSTGDTLAYGSAIFWHYITQKIAGNTAMRDVWELFKNDTQDCNLTGCPVGSYEITEIPLVEQYLAGKGTSLSDVFKSFGAANYTRDYVDAAQSNFPSVTPVNYGSAYTTLNTGSQTLNHLATRYYRFDPVTAEHDLRFSVTFTGDAATSWGLQVVLTRADGSRTLKSATVNSGAATLTVDGFGTTYTRAVLIVSNLSTTRTSDSKTYSFAMAQTDYAYAAVTSSRTLTAGWNLVAFPVYAQYPNPVQAISIDSGGDTLTASEILYYNNSAATLKDASALGSGFQGLGTPGAGYWLFVQSNTTISLNALEFSDTYIDVPVGAGWNMVGNPFAAAVAWSDAKVSVLETAVSAPLPLSAAAARGWAPGALFDWTGAAYQLRTHNSGFSLQPWTGYWLEAKRAFILRMYK